ncbi:hypothetical protein ACFV2Q_03975 [Streptomyces sp. NPDC059650]|uniref:hypothetical protein n=1 Tax=Streptomyces sp. NPDC059650 TaxID=3346896 RepID=UPI0036B95081
MTTDLAKAQQWLESCTEVSGLEGIVVKPMHQPYKPEYRGWYKLRRRDTTEAIIGAITGTLIRPHLLLLGRNDKAGHLHPVGRTAPLRPDAHAVRLGPHRHPRRLHARPRPGRTHTDRHLRPYGLTTRNDTTLRRSAHEKNAARLLLLGEDIAVEC